MSSKEFSFFLKSPVVEIIVLLVFLPVDVFTKLTLGESNPKKRLEAIEANFHI